ncbi:MAG: GTP-binding protein [Bacteriovoracaceae bacterium]|nr:GTP-binding protein [Bacteriovoracaceae bacterium]
MSNPNKDGDWISQFASNMKLTDRPTLSKAITYLESTLERDESIAQKIVELCWPYQKESVVIGVSGPPGVGKSTFINQLGKYLLAKNQKMAVLSIDPSSSLTGGSILGDKTRMHDLANHPHCYIRPSSSLNSLGGVNPSTREVILLLKAFGFHYIFVESVGVGQSESDLASMVDWFWLLVAPGQGDDLQGMKRGVIELADVVLINKCDSTHMGSAEQTFLHYQMSGQLNHGSKNASIYKISSTSDQGLSPLVNHFENSVDSLKLFDEKNHLLDNRKRQQQIWVKKIVEKKYLSRLNNFWEKQSSKMDFSKNPAISASEIYEELISTKGKIGR